MQNFSNESSKIRDLLNKTILSKKLWNKVGELLLMIGMSIVAVLTALVIIVQYIPIFALSLFPFYLVYIFLSM